MDRRAEDGGASGVIDPDPDLGTAATPDGDSTSGHADEAAQEHEPQHAAGRGPTVRGMRPSVSDRPGRCPSRATASSNQRGALSATHLLTLPTSAKRRPHRAHPAKPATRRHSGTRFERAPSVDSRGIHRRPGSATLRRRPHPGRRISALLGRMPRRSITPAINRIRPERDPASHEGLRHVQQFEARVRHAPMEIRESCVSSVVRTKGDFDHH
jgi:hypothetical protein